MYTTFRPFTANAATVSSLTSGMIFLPYSNNAYYTFYQSGSQVVDQTTSGYVGQNGPVPNYLSVLPGSGMIRCTGMALRVTYQGTELQRAGRYYAGLCPLAHPAQGGDSTTNLLSPLSVVCNTPAPNTAQLKQCMTNQVSGRVTDGTFEAIWTPNGVPSYQNVADSLAGFEAYQAPSAGGIVNSSIFATAQGDAGAQRGQHALVFFVEGDTPSAPANSGNAYTIEVIWHWEVVPQNPYAVAYDLTPSAYRVQELQTCLNAVRSSQGHVHQLAAVGTMGASNLNVPSESSMFAEFVRMTKPYASKAVKTAAGYAAREMKNAAMRKLLGVGQTAGGRRAITNGRA